MQGDDQFSKGPCTRFELKYIQYNQPYRLGKSYKKPTNFDIYDTLKIPILNKSQPKVRCNQ